MRQSITHNKILFFGILAIVGFLVGAAIFSLASSPKTSTNTDTITVSNVEVKNFKPQVTEQFPTGDQVFVDTDEYQIIYQETGNVFLISIVSAPFDIIRRKAEVDLLKQLNISQEQACALNVQITTPLFANPEQAGEIFDLSFCKNNNSLN